MGDQADPAAGAALEVVQGLVAETGAGGVWWSRLCDLASVARDTDVKAALKSYGVEAGVLSGISCTSREVQTGQRGFYRVFTPYWKAMRGAGVVAAPEPAPKVLRGVETGLASDRLEDWRLVRR